MQYKQLNKKEREIISQLLAQNKTCAEIAKVLNRHKSTISREIKRNSNIDGVYWALDADFKSDVRKELPRRSRILKSNKELFEYVKSKLKIKWSPKQISERLKIDYTNNKSMQISHETIYTYLYILPRGELKKELISCLRKERLERKKRQHYHKPRLSIQDAISIRERPPETENRAVPGHWEGDLIVGKEHNSYIVTIVERTTRTLILVHLKTKKAEEVRKAFEKEIKSLPKQMRLSMTYDRGTEMMEHKLFTKNTKMKVYFADPHSPWQRGTNENTNGLLRQYFPKSTDLSIYTRKQLKEIQDEMNNRPRAVLNYKTPKEMFDILTLNCCG